MAQTLTDKAPSGTTLIGCTLYTVYVLELSDVAKDAGIVGRFGLVGPKGSTYYVTDYGQNYRLNSVCLGGGVSWKAAPRPLRGLERKHLTMFYGEPTTEGRVM